MVFFIFTIHTSILSRLFAASDNKIISDRRANTRTLVVGQLFTKKEDDKEYRMLAVAEQVIMYPEGVRLKVIFAPKTEQIYLQILFHFNISHIFLDSGVF